jgi:hypothetical protein
MFLVHGHRRVCTQCRADEADKCVTPNETHKVCAHTRRVPLGAAEPQVALKTFRPVAEFTKSSLDSSRGEKVMLLLRQHNLSSVTGDWYAKTAVFEKSGWQLLRALSKSSQSAVTIDWQRHMPTHTSLGSFPADRLVRESSTVTLVSAWQVIRKRRSWPTRDKILISDSEVTALAARYARQSVKILSQGS